ncbi:Protein polybromo-1 [Thelohanellus kitauei]|uniref:Protein polybromo-1 n=1 Tax=Thelohanellus kitauei TaxID=669202 RepID=A0A0C2IEZ8_THEKT|nr:Protein polybromo-1 [Thelohanellus kitauei]
MDPTTVINNCLDIMNSLLDLKDLDGNIMVLEMERLIYNEPVPIGPVQKRIPRFLNDIHEKVKMPSAKRKRSAVSYNLEYSDENSEYGLKIPSRTVDELLLHDPGNNYHVLELFNFVAGQTDSGGWPVMEFFYRLPIQKGVDIDEGLPRISFSQIRRRLMQKKYPSEKDIYDDLVTMFNYAIEKNSKTTPQYKWARKMMQQLQMFYETMKVRSMGQRNQVYMSHEPLNILESTQKSEDSFKKRAVDIFNRLLNLKDGSETHYLASNYVKLPSPETYPDYYRIISNPIDLSIIKERLEEYKSQRDFASDMGLLIANARAYHKTSSTAYQDTIEIEKFLKAFLTSKIKHYIKIHTQISVQSALPPEPPDPRVQELFDVIHRSNHKNIPLITLARIQKQIQDLGAIDPANTNFDQFFERIMTILQQNIIDSRSSEKTYYVNASINEKPTLALMNHVNNKYHSVSIEIPPSMFFTCKQIVSFMYFMDNEDIYNVSCINCLSLVHSQCGFNIGTREYGRLIDINLIAQAVHQGQYQRIDCFMYDTVELLRRARVSYPVFSEPYIHSTIMFNRLLAMYSNLETKKYHINRIFDWSQFFYFQKIDENSEESQELVTLPALSRELLNNAYNETGEVYNFFEEIFDPSRNSVFSGVEYKSVVYVCGDFVLVLM